jgi:CheY-like chemotaxis protein
VDDEPPARELLVSYIEKMDDLEVTGQCGNALEAFAFIQKYPVHILFLDIQMPRMNGLELIKSLQERPRIILTTAFREFAVEGFGFTLRGDKGCFVDAYFTCFGVGGDAFDEAELDGSFGGLAAAFNLFFVLREVGQCFGVARNTDEVFGVYGHKPVGIAAVEVLDERFPHLVVDGFPTGVLGE